MAIDTGRVAIAGLVGGVVSNIVGYLAFGVLLGPRLDAEASAVAPALKGLGNTGPAIGMNVGRSFLVAMLTVWLYAALSSRFGAKWATAACAALLVWIFGVLFHLDFVLFGMMSPVTFALASALALVQLLAATTVGARIYGRGDA